MLHAMQGAPHLPAFSHTEFLESLAQQTLPSILTERFGNQVLSCSAVCATYCHGINRLCYVCYAIAQSQTLHRAVPASP